jgi:hypothetical protein
LNEQGIKMDTLLEYNEIKDFLELQSPTVRENVTIVDCDVVGQSFMLHIDKQTPKEFIPMMPRGAALSENNTTARVTVAPSLMGCFIGYARALHDFEQGNTDEMKKDFGYMGGYEISAIDFNYLEVNQKLVFDAPRSQEHWLVAYNDATQVYKSKQVGKIFIKEVTMSSVHGSVPVVNYTIYFECNSPDGFLLTATQKVDLGFYKVIVNGDDCKVESNFILKRISSEEYMEAKRFSAQLLSRQEKPTYLAW